MHLPESFVFSQHSLQDFLDCPQRFLLRHGKQLDWPAVQALPVQEHERRMELGTRFHRLVQQHLLGIPTGHLTATITDPDLSLLWANYLDFQPAALPGRRFPELVLSAPLAGRSLTAKLDLLVVSPEGALTVLDWKTESRLPKAVWLKEKLQTRVYRLLVQRAGSRFLDGEAIAPEAVSFQYWFAAFPEIEFRFPYSTAQAADDERYLSAMIETIVEQPEEDFERTTNLGHCQYCVYRSYCDRGQQAGLLTDDMDLDGNREIPDWTLDQIDEIFF